MIEFKIMHAVIIRELEEDENSFLLFHIKRTMDPYPFTIICSLERLSEIWSHLNHKFMPRCSFWDLIHTAEHQEMLSGMFSEFFATGKQPYQDEN